MKCKHCHVTGQQRYIEGSSPSSHWCKRKRSTSEAVLAKNLSQNQHFFHAPSAYPTVSNRGNTCHLGVVLSSLAMIPEVRDAADRCLRKPMDRAGSAGDPAQASARPVTRALCNVFAELGNQLQSSQQEAISQLIAALPCSNNWSAQGSQADSRDAFLVLLEELDAEGAREVCCLFEGQTKSVVVCQEGHTSITAEPFRTLPLHVPRTPDLAPCSISDLIGAAERSVALEGQECSMIEVE